MREKESYDAKGFSLISDIFFSNFNCENVWIWVPNLVLKFHDNPTVNEFKIVILPR